MSKIATQIPPAPRSWHFSLQILRKAGAISMAAIALHPWSSVISMLTSSLRKDAPGASSPEEVTVCITKT